MINLTKYLTEKTTSLALEIGALCLVFFVAYIVFANNTYGLKALTNSDIHWEYEWSISVINNVNPYLKQNPQHMLTQEKVPGLLPLYFYVLGSLAKIADYSVVSFFDLLRVVIFFIHITLGVTIYLLVRSHGKVVALLCMLVFMFNRWVLGSSFQLKQDSLACLLLLVSIHNLKNKKYLAFLLYGLATGIKHLTLLVFPIYLLYMAEPILVSIKNTRVSAKVLKPISVSALLFLLFLAPLVISAFPFVTKTPDKFAASLLYNLTREPEGENVRVGFDKLLILYNQDQNNTQFYYMLPRLPFVLILLLVAYLYMSHKINVWVYCALTYTVFIGFNPVVFNQYYTWLFVFVPLGLAKAKT